MSILQELFNLAQQKILTEATSPDGRVDVDFNLDDFGPHEGTIFVHGVKTFDEAMDVLDEPEITAFIDSILAPYDLSLSATIDIGHEIHDDGVRLDVALPVEEMPEESDEDFMNDLRDDDEDK
jgi:hypothetical protein